MAHREVLAPLELRAHDPDPENNMISWLIGMVTGMIYDVIGIAARLKPEDAARRLKARWALSLGVWNSGGADDYYLDELDRFFKEDKTVLDTLEKSLPEQSASFFVKRKKAWLAGFRASPSSPA